MATSAQKAGPKAVPAADPNPSDNPEGAAGKKKKSPKKTLVVLAVVLLLLGGIGGGAWYFLGQQADPDADPDAPPVEAKKEPAKAPVFINLEPFTVNLLPQDAGEQFLQSTMTIQVGDAKDVDLFKLYMPEVRSRILVLLSSKKGSEIATEEGKKKLAEEIITLLKKPFTGQIAPQAINNVFFTSFVIQ